MIAFEAGDWFFQTVTSGTFLLAFAVALFAGLISFFSPCVVPLLPGYLSYVSGVSVEDLDRSGRSRIVLGSVLFVFGFSAVFVAGGALFGSFGQRLAPYQREMSIAAGLVLILMGAAFLGAFRFLQRDVRVHRFKGTGLAMAPVLGVVFGVGWTPCIGPTLTAVLVLANNEGTMARGALLTVAYCLGLGLPFVLAAMSFRRFMRASDWLRRHQRAVVIAGGSMLIATGVLLVTGWWNDLTIGMQQWISSFDVIV